MSRPKRDAPPDTRELPAPCKNPLCFSCRERVDANANDSAGYVAMQVARELRVTNARLKPGEREVRAAKFEKEQRELKERAERGRVRMLAKKKLN